MKEVRIAMGFFIFTSLIIFGVSRIHLKATGVGENWTVNPIGVLVNVEIIPTSFNKTPKSQLSFVDKIVVLNGYPQLTFGDTIYGYYDKNKLKSIEDMNGDTFYIFEYVIF